MKGEAGVGEFAELLQSSICYIYEHEPNFILLQQLKRQGNIKQV